MEKIKILFVCKANAFRSQIAESLFNKYNKNKNYEAFSSGLNANKFIGKSIKDILEKHPGAKKIWKELNLPESILNKFPKQLYSKLINQADKIIFLLENKKFIPSEFENSKKVEFWKIQDGVTKQGKIKSLEDYKKIIKKIKIKIKDLIIKLEENKFE
jgi:protein-tyrosine-phosphatase